MKKTFTIFCAAALLSSLEKTNAQSWVIGGNTVTKDTSIGTKNAFALRFNTNNSQRMVISSGGAVGIGTNTLTKAKFSVNGAAGSTVAIFGNNNHGVSLVYDNPAIGFNSYYNSAWKALDAGYGGTIAVNTSTGAMQFSNLPNGSKDATVKPVIGMTLSAKGYLGLGTTNPEARLHVAGGGEILEGNLKFTTDQESLLFPNPGSSPKAMMYMFASGTTNTARMVIAHSTAYPNWGLQYDDTPDQFNFLGNGNNIMSINLSTGLVGIGTATPSYQLDVESSGTAVYGNSTGGSYGVYGNSTYTGVYGVGGSYGVYGYSGSDYGVYGSSGYVGVNGSGTSYGLNGYGTGDGSYGVAGTGSYIGVYGSSDGTALVGSSTNGEGANIYSTNSYGLVAGTQRTDANYAAVFNGNTYAYGSYLTSDKNLKKNITELGNAMSIINKLKPKTYEFIQEGKYAVMHLPSGQQYGLLAQDLETVLPGLVKTVDYIAPIAAKVADTSAATHAAPSAKGGTATDDKITTKAVNYVELIPIMIKAMQEQQATIDAQNAKIDALTNLVSQLTKNSSGNVVSASSAFLGNASPNPANKSTRILYGVSSNTAKAELVIYSIGGQKLQQLELNKSGLIDINTSNLSAGTYTYTLLADGVVVDTKKMIIGR